MLLAPIPANESDRLEALRQYNILDTLPEQAYDDLTHLAAQICATPIASITLIDKDRQWFKSSIGMTDPQTPRDVSFCGHAVMNPRELLVVDDARIDARFADNPFVTGNPHIAFYAGAPLVTPDGHALGTICVIDQEARKLTDDQRQALEALSRQIMAQLELRRKYLEMVELSRTRDEAQRELQQSQARFDAFMNNSPALAFIKNERSEFVYANAALLKHYDWTLEDVLGKSSEVIWKDSAALLREHDQQVLAENRLMTFEEPIAAADGQVSTWLSFKFPLSSENGEKYLAGMSIDITERKYYEKQMDVYQRKLEEAVARLEELSVTDPLCGLRNKRSFLETFEEEFGRARRFEIPLSLVVLDVDFFKRYNDTEGHPAGDEVLRSVGKIIRENSRPNDFLARYGGEEFVILLRSTPKEGAFLVAERLRRAFKDFNWPRRKVTASLGVAELTPDMVDSTALFSAADQALYRAKEAGRDRVVVA